MRVLITGIAGSGGSYLAEHVAVAAPDAEIHGISRWHSASGMDNLSELRRRAGSRLRLHECDLDDFPSVLAALRESRPERIFHLASHANVRASFTTPVSVTANNVLGTLNLLEAVRAAELNPVIQVCSTSEVYGQVNADEVPIREDAPLRPVSPYAVSKATQDLLGFAYFRSYGMRIFRTRMFAYLNPRRTDLFATSFALQVALIEAGRLGVLRHGNLDSQRTLIDVRDAMEAYWIASEKCAPGEAYNIGGLESRTVGEFLEVLKSRARAPIRTEPDPALFRPADVTLQIPDTSKFAKATGWAPRIPFEESVAFLLESCRRGVERMP